jgi:serine/threonine protein kinase
VNRWGEFEILDEIGRGGFGTVYRAFHPALAREVALKLIPVPTGQPHEIEKALDEARRLARANHHNVVTVHDARYLDGHVGICMELIHGESLAQIVERQGRLGADETIAIGTTLCRALAAIHRVGVIHSDVKAQNVMRQDGGRIVLMDFGAGRQLKESDQTTRLQIIGTPSYMAPEIFHFKDPSPSSDIYSLGVLLFYLLTTQFPVDGRTLEEFATAHAKHTRRRLGDLRDDLPADLIGIIEKALEPHSRDRYQTPGEMLADLSSRRVTVRPRPRRSSDTPQRKAVEKKSSSANAIRSTLARTLVMVVTAVAAVWLLGFLASTAYDVMFGLTGEFASSSAISWLVIGFRTLPLPLAYMLMAFMTFIGVRFIWRIADRLVPGVRSWGHRTTRVWEAATTKAGLNEGSSAASAILIGQVLCLALVWWGFHDLLIAFTTPVASGTPGLYGPLLSSNEAEWLLFCGVASVLALASGTAWATFLRKRVPGTGMASVSAGLAITAIFAAMFAVPWKIIYQSTFQTAMFQSERCYIVGKGETRAMLWCAAAGRMHGLVIDANDPRLKPSPTQESIFAGIQSSRREDSR